MKFLTKLLLACFLLIGSAFSASNEQVKEYQYQTPDNLLTQLKQIASKNKDVASFTSIGQTPGNREIGMLTLGTGDNYKPAILVVANMEGNYPLASEAAIQLANNLTTDWKAELDNNSWMIIACGNPDGYARFFDSPQFESTRNGKSFNDDKDDATDEDGPDDLNKDGYITTMRQLHPEGTWVEVASNPLLLRKADNLKGEVGKYKIYNEGIDNDGDGKINEDGSGGINPGRNFPHAFKHYTTSHGMWAASELETRAVLEYAFDHTEIGMVIVFGAQNSLKEVPSASNKSQSGENSFKVPDRWVKRYGFEKDKKYPISELLEMVKEATGYGDLTEDQLMQWLGAGAAVNPDRADIKYWEKISEQYNDFIKEAGLDGKRLDSPKFPSGSIEEWAYYQYGVPTYAFDFWTLPKPEKKTVEADSTILSIDSLENMSTEDVIALGEEKITAFLEANKAPKMYTAERVIKGLETERMTPKKMAELMRKMSEADDDEEGGDKTEEALFAAKPASFLSWQPFDHPTLGQVEIGGMIPYADVTPLDADVSELINKQLPFVKELAGMLPKINIKNSKVTNINDDVWRVEVWIANNGFLPYPTHQGKRCQRPAPIAVTAIGDGYNILDGKKRNVLGLLDGTSGVSKVTWMIQGAKGSDFSFVVELYKNKLDEKSIKLEEGVN